MEAAEARRNRNGTQPPQEDASPRNDDGKALNECSDAVATRDESRHLPTIEPLIEIDGDGNRIEMRYVPGLPGYLVTADGRVYSRVQTKNCWSKRLRLRKDRDGYFEVEVSRDGKRKIVRAHRLVALAFIGPPPFDGAEVRHKDGNPANNVVENLAWGSHRENMADRTRHDRHAKGARNGRALVNEEQVREIRRLYASGHTLPMLAQRYNMKLGGVSAIVNRRTWKHVA